MIITRRVFRDRSSLDQFNKTETSPKLSFVSDVIKFREYGKMSQTLTKILGYNHVSLSDDLKGFHGTGDRWILQTRFQRHQFVKSVKSESVLTSTNV